MDGMLKCIVNLVLKTYWRFLRIEKCILNDEKQFK